MDTQPETKVYFFKALVSNAFIFNGKPVDWEPLAGNNGVASFVPSTDGPVIKALNDAVTKGVGGVLKISEADYLKKKRTQPWTPSKPKSWLDEPLKVAGRAYQPPAPPVLAKEKQLAAADEAPSPPMEGEDVPQKPPDQPDFKSSDFKPATRKMQETPNPI